LEQRFQVQILPAKVDCSAHHLGRAIHQARRADADSQQWVCRQPNQLVDQVVGKRQHTFGISALQCATRTLLDCPS
jgi:hypothetical protein